MAFSERWLEPPENEAWELDLERWNGRGYAKGRVIKGGTQECCVQVILFDLSGKWELRLGI